MSITTNQLMQYLGLLADPEQNRITREAWTVTSSHEDLLWAGWQPDSVVSVDNEPTPEWYSGMPAAMPVIQRQTTTRVDAQAAMAFALLEKFGLLNSEAASDQPATRPAAAGAPNTKNAITPPRGVEGLKHLAALDELHREESLGRVGWLFVAGSISIAGENLPCCFPLFQRRVKFTRVGGAFYPQWQGSLQRHSLLRRRDADNVEDVVDTFLQTGAGSQNPDVAGEAAAELLAHFGVAVSSIAATETHPTSIVPAQGTVVVPGAGFYLTRPSRELSSTHNDLTRWTGRHLGETAVSQLYRTTDSSLDPVVQRRTPIRSALPLNARQRDAIDRLDAEPVVTVSGPPGTGKTHMIVAAASDAVAHGYSVLIATKSDFAAESTSELLGFYPTPQHVRFGNEHHRRRVADLLSSGHEAGITNEQLASLEQSDAAAWADLQAVGKTVLAALARKQAFQTARDSTQLTSAAGAPRVLSAGFDLANLDRALAATETTSGLRQRRAVARLRKLIGAADSASLPAMRTSIAGARAEVAISDALEQAMGDDLDELWAHLDRCETDARATQAIVDIARRSRPAPAALTSASALATALRTSLGNSELQIPIEASTAFLHHVPFWIGTLDEIEATLPANPGMFDLVIFDEASQIDQLAAIPALCRARRALVVGDPKQLRHTSSVTSQQIDAARTHAEIPEGDGAAILDIAANSLFDVAAAASPITWLDEHFRSAPHLIQFSSERWYDGQLRLMTQHPRNEDLDVIHTHRVSVGREGHTNPGEVQAIVTKLRSLHAAGLRRSVGVITPFSEQANALEQAIVASFDYDMIRDLRLRIGTVRGVQGTERDIVLLSLVIDERDFGEPLAIVEDPHLFNVMTTRARSQMDVFHSFDPTRLPAGVLADWFRYESRPPGIAHRSAPATSPWTARLAEALGLAGLRVVTNYPVAGWTIDLVVGEGDAAFGVETTVHPSGPEAHAERHLTLRRAGWDLVSMFENNWVLQTEDAAVHLAGIAVRRQR